MSEPLRAAGILHGFSLRTSGGDGDAVIGAIGASGATLYQVSQVHGARIVEARGPVEAVLREEADGVVARPTAGAMRAVAVRTADCVPVLLAERATGAVAAVHAGWRGVVAGVVGAAVEALAAAGGATLVAAIGPCIERCCFEVGEDVADAIEGACPGPTGSVAGRRAGGKAFVDLRLAVRRQLLAAGLSAAHIDDVAGCTRCDPWGRFFSYRREGKGAGRNLGVIVAPA